jgi:integrase/recombinase XerC
LHAHPSAHTLRAYRTGLEVTLEQLEGENILHPHRHWAHRYTRALETAPNGRPGRGASTLKPATVRSRVAAARALYAALRWAGATDADPFADVRPAPDREAPEDKRQPYPPESVDRLLAHASPRERAVVLLGAHAGLRVSDIAALRAVNVNLGARRLQVARGKGGKARGVDLSIRLCAALEALEPAPDGRVIALSAQGIRAALRRLCLEAGVAYQGVHSLRHTAGTRIYRATRDLKATARHLGHARVETSAVYAKYGDDEVREIVAEW